MFFFEFCGFYCLNVIVDVVEGESGIVLRGGTDVVNLVCLKGFVCIKVGVLGKFCVRY